MLYVAWQQSARPAGGPRQRLRDDQLRRTPEAGLFGTPHHRVL